MFSRCTLVAKSCSLLILIVCWILEAFRNKNWYFSVKGSSGDWYSTVCIVERREGRLGGGWVAVVQRILCKSSCRSEEISDQQPNISSFPEAYETKRQISLYNCLFYHQISGKTQTCAIVSVLDGRQWSAWKEFILTVFELRSTITRFVLQQIKMLPHFITDESY